MLDAKIKQKELVNKADVSNLIKNFDVNTKLATIAIKTDIKQNKMKQLDCIAYYLDNWSNNPLINFTLKIVG